MFPECKIGRSTAGHGADDTELLTFLLSAPATFAYVVSESLATQSDQHKQTITQLATS